MKNEADKLKVKQMQYKNVNQSIKTLQKQVSKLHCQEFIDSTTGISYNAENKSMAKLKVVVQSGKSWTSCRGNCYVELGIQPSSICGKDYHRLRTKSVRAVRGEIFWQQTFVFEGLESRAGLLQATVLEETIGEPRVIGKAEIALGMLVNQSMHQQWYSLENQGNDTERILLEVVFSYSKLEPVQQALLVLHRTRRKLQNELDVLENEMSRKDEAIVVKSRRKSSTFTACNAFLHGEENQAVVNQDSDLCIIS